MERANRYFESGDLTKAEIEYLSAFRIDRSNQVAASRLGLIYNEQGKWSKAFAFLTTAKELAPNDLAVRYRLGLSYLTGRRYQEAQAEARYVLEREPANDDALLLLAEASVVPADIEATRQVFERIRQSAERRSGFHTGLGVLSLRQENFQAAEASLQRALKLEPNSGVGHLALANLYWTQNDLKQAEREFKSAAELSPARSPRRLQYANFKIRTGDLNAGIEILRGMTKNAPDYLPAWLRLADIAFARKEFDDCSSLLKKILARDPSNYEGLMLQGRVSLARGEAQRAVNEFGRLSKLYPRVAQLHYHSAIAHLLNKEADKAVGALNQAVELDPNYAEAILLLAELNVRRGEVEAAISSLRQLIQKQPNVPQSYLLLATAHSTKSNWDDAVAVYRRMTEVFPKNPQPHLLEGLVRLQQSKKADARQAFERALEQTPNYLPALEQLVDLELAEKRIPSALTRVQKQVEQFPDSVEARLLLAKVHMAQRDWNQAEAVLLKAIELQPDSKAIYFALAQIYVSSNRHQQALEKLQKILTTNPKDAAALMQMGMIYNELKSYAAARDAYERLLEINPKFTPALNNLAYLYSEHLGKLDRAYELARRARDLLPNDPFTADTFGWILFKRKEYPWALSLIQESAEKLPIEPEIQYHLGMAHYMMGEEEPARIALQRAHQANKQFTGHEQINRFLALLALDPKRTDEKTIEDLENRLSEEAGDPIALARLAAIIESKGESEKAAKVYERGLNENPKNVQAMYKLAKLYAERLGQPQKAIELLKSARNVAPDDARVIHLLGRLAFQRGDSKWSASLLEESARKMPGNAQVHFDLAWVHYSLGKVADAERDMRSAMASDSQLPDMEAAKRFLSISPLANDPFRAGQEAAQIQKILAADPDYAPALMAAAVIYENKGDVNSAKQAYERVLAKYPMFTPAQKRLATLYVERLGDYKQAYNLAVHARAAESEDAEVARLLGIIEYHRENYRRAAQLLTESSKTRTTDAELFYYVGMAHYRLKEQSQSRKALQRALALNTEARWVNEANQVLAELR